MANDRTFPATASGGGGGRPVTTATTAAGVKVKWDDSKMESSYANVCNISWTREEVVLVFGLNQAWQGGQKEVTVQVNDRIILSPFAAKRLTELLSNALKEYEGRFGPLGPAAGANSPAR